MTLPPADGPFEPPHDAPTGVGGTLAPPAAAAAEPERERPRAAPPPGEPAAAPAGPPAGLPPVEAYRERASDTVARVADALETRGDVDLHHLVDAASAALAQIAEEELRRAILQMRLEIENAQVAGHRPAALTPASFGRFLAALDRASAVVETHLDRERIEPLLIRLLPEDFDLGDALRERLAYRGLRPGVGGVRLRIGAAPIRGDRGKLLDAIGHLVTRFWGEVSFGEELVIAVESGGGVAEGFVGLSPSHLAPDVLMEALHVPFQLEQAEIDLGYARALMERHGGALFVATRPGGAVGFGFRLPASAEGASGPAASG